MHPGQARATIKEVYRLQREAISRLFEANPQGLLDAVKQCASSVKEDILAILISDARITVADAAKYL